MNAQTLSAEAPQSQHDIIPQDLTWHKEIADVIIEQITTVPSNSKKRPLRENRDVILAKRDSFAEYLQKNLRVETTKEWDLVLVCWKYYREKLPSSMNKHNLQIGTKPEISNDEINPSHTEADLERSVLVAATGSMTQYLDMYRLYQSFWSTQKDEVTAAWTQQRFAALAVDALDTPDLQA